MIILLMMIASYLYKRGIKCIWGGGGRGHFTTRVIRFPQ